MTPPHEDRDIEFAQQLGSLQSRMETMQDALLRHTQEEQVFQRETLRMFREIDERLRTLKTEHVIARSGAVVVVKVFVWGAAIIGVLAASWQWLGDHIRWVP